MHYIILLLLLATINTFARTPLTNKKLLRAAKQNNHAKVQKQLARKATVNARNKKGQTALHKTSSPEIINELIITGADLNYTTKGKDKRTPLYDALVSGNRDKAMTLIISGAHVNTRHKNGQTPLKWAIEHNDYELVFYLIQAGAHVSSKLTGFIAKHANQAIKTLITEYRKANKNNSTLNKLDQYGLAPIHYATIENNPIKLDALILAHGQINLQNSLGKTPLHIAVESNVPNMVEKLLALFAKINITDNKDRTPLQIAQELNLTKITRMLLAHGAHIIF